MEQPRRPFARYCHFGQLMLTCCILLAGCAANPSQTKLFDRLGGLPAITAVVDKTIDSAAKDPRTSRSFKGLKLEGVKEAVVAQLCESSGGPCKYEGASMVKAHKGLDITSAEFDAFAQQLVATLDQFKVGTREKDELLQLLGPMKRDIVTK
jgi:hemoglobin